MRTRGFPRSAARLPQLLLLLALLTTACITPIGVREAGFAAVFAEQSDSALTSGKLSSPNRQMLSTLGLAHTGGDEQELLVELEAYAAATPRRELYALIAELRYLQAAEDRDPAEFLTAAICAYIYLFCDELGTPADPYDPRFRLACDIYNRSLAQALLDEDGYVSLSGGVFETSLGTVTLTASRPGFPWTVEQFHQFLPSDKFQVRGLRERVRTSGLGVPLIALRSKATTDEMLNNEHIGRNVKLAATAVLEMEGGLKALRARQLRGDLQLYLAGSVDTVKLGGHDAPLEADLTAPLAFMLQASELWGYQLAGFLGSKAAQFPPGIYFVQPYQRGKIPLILVHGTASSPVAWAQMLNGLNIYPELRRNFQIWFAIYNTGTPILYNAAEIRDSLNALVRDLDPEGSDPALRRMVLAGHSQGGLITRLLVTTSGDQLWALVSDKPFEEYAQKMSAEDRELLRRCIYFTPLEFVQRAVFISTPHHGSFVAGSWIGSFSRKLITLPSQITSAGKTLFEGSRVPPELRRGLTSVDNMKPGSLFVKLLQNMPFAPGVTLHSIISVKGSGPAEKGHDGVVGYSSAHLEGVASEFIVRHGHSCQNEPETIGELCRILLEHLAAGQGAGAPTARGN